MENLSKIRWKLHNPNSELLGDFAPAMCCRTNASAFCQGTLALGDIQIANRSPRLCRTSDTTPCHRHQSSLRSRWVNIRPDNRSSHTSRSASASFDGELKRRVQQHGARLATTLVSFGWNGIAGYLAIYRWVNSRMRIGEPVHSGGTIPEIRRQPGHALEKRRNPIPRAPSRRRNRKVRFFSISKSAVDRQTGRSKSRCVLVEVRFPLNPRSSRKRPKWLGGLKEAERK